MSKYVKNLVTDHLKNRLSGVDNALLVNIIGLDAIRTTKLRKDLRAKNISLTLVKNSLARRATEGTPLAAAFESSEGTLAIVWGSEDIVSLAKEIVRLTELKEFAGFEARGGVMDGKKLTAADAKGVSKWPSRTEQLSIIAGQILGPGAKLASQLKSVGGALVSQIKQRVEDLEKSGGGAAPAAEAPVAAAEAPPAG
jgi:ribosomal protein L10